jgi:putative ABC transport system permease protein
MSLWKIAWRSIQRRSLASTLTGLSMALGVGLIVAVMVVSHVVENYFNAGTGLGYNLVIGKKGSSFQLVMNTVYYLDRPIENVPWSYYQEFLPAAERNDGRNGQFAAWIDKAVPVNLGDYFHGFRVVGTTPAMFGALELTPGQKFQFTAGENFASDEYFAGVLGATVAKQTGLGVGDTFQPTHAVPEDGHVHEEKFRVTGILAPTGTPIDRAVYVNIEGFYLLKGHALETTPKSQTSDVNAGRVPDTIAADSKHETTAGEAGHQHNEEPDHAKSTGGNRSDDDDHDHQENHEHKSNADEPGGSETGQHEGHHHDQDRESGSVAEPHNHEHDGHSHADGHEHEHEHHHEPLPESQREVTAILVLTKSIGGLPPEVAAQQIIKPINKGTIAQAVQPIQVITQFLQMFLDPLRALLLGLTVLIVIISGISILVSIYNSMAERQHEIAVMRALGAGRSTVMRIMLLESLLLAGVGGLVGWLLCHTALGILTPWLTDWTGVTFTGFHFVGAELLLIPGIIALATLVGFLPAWSAYRTDVAKALTVTP